MPTTRSKAKAAPTAKVRVVKTKDGFNLSNAVSVALVGLLVSLIGTGIASMFSLAYRQAELASQVKETSAALARHLDHAVDKESYDKRDRAIQKMLDNAATKEELNGLKEELRDLNTILRDMVADGHIRSKR